MSPSAIYSKSGKGVQEASGKTSLLKRAERAVLSAIDGRATVGEVAQKVGKPFDAAFQALITQLDRDGFVREVAAAAAGSVAVPAFKPPAAKPPGSSGEDLDFTGIFTASTLKSGAKPADDASPRAREQEQALYRARQEAEARAQQERERAREAEARLRSESEAKARAEIEAKFRAETERRLREETEKRLREEAEARLKAEIEAKAKAAREAALRVAAEAKAKAEAEAQARIEAERRAREEAERKAREEAEKARREAEELRQRLEEERRAREEAERKAREEAERKAREEAERKAREEAERKAREAEEKRRREEEERRAREEAERQAKAEAERKAKAEAERKAREAEEKRRQEAEERRQEEEARRQKEEERQAREAAEREARDEAREEATEEEEQREPATQAEAPAQAAIAAPAAPTAAPPPPPAAATSAGGLEDLLSEIESFSQREEEEQKRKQAEAEERRARKEAKEKAEAERRAKAEAERERKAAEKRRRKEEEAQRAREAEERRAREEEERVQEAARKRKAEAAAAAAAAAAAPQTGDDIGVTEDDLGMDDVRRDEAAVSKEARKAQREREREAREREKEARAREKSRAREPAAYKPVRRHRRNWGRMAATTFFVLLGAGLVALHVMPLPVEDYERAATQALGRAVRIDSAHFSLLTGGTLNLSGVRVGEQARITTARAHPSIASLFGDAKAFDRIELEGVTLAQEALAEPLFAAKAKGRDFSVERVTVKDLRLTGPLSLPLLAADLRFAQDGTLRIVTVDGPDGLSAKLTPGQDRVDFDVTAASFTVPIARELSLGSFAMKGSATRQGMKIEGWGGTVLDGALSGTANVRWGAGWNVDGVMTARGINAAVFAPALLSRGKADGTGKFSMSGEPGKLGASSRIEGRFSVEKGVLGSFDLSRAIQTEGRQAGGRTEFAELNGQATYERGTVALRNVSIGAGALQAGASADIAQNGALTGRIVADIRTASQALRTTLVLGGTVRDPQVRN